MLWLILFNNTKDLLWQRIFRGDVYTWVILSRFVWLVIKQIVYLVLTVEGEILLNVRAYREVGCCILLLLKVSAITFFMIHGIRLLLFRFILIIMVLILILTLTNFSRFHWLGLHWGLALLRIDWGLEAATLHHFTLDLLKPDVLAILVELRSVLEIARIYHLNILNDSVLTNLFHKLLRFLVYLRLKRTYLLQFFLFGLGSVLLLLVALSVPVLGWFIKLLTCSTHLLN